jgi:D-xylono/L-arabinono-1,4-lactonase
MVVRHASMAPQQCSSTRAVLAECPLWDSERRRLLYLDLMNPTIFEFNPENSKTRSITLDLRAPLGGLCLRRTGGYLVFNADGVFSLNDALAVTARVCRPHSSFSLAPPNDVTVHPNGQILVATADARECAPIGGLYCLSAIDTWHMLCEGLVVGNGPAFAPSGDTMYLADSPQHVILVYHWNADRSSLEDKRVFAQVPPSAGFPDGLTVDSTGHVWNARWNGGSVVRYAPDGSEASAVELPTRCITSCTFGGADLCTLFITTASDSSESRSRKSDDYAGHLFKLDLAVMGTISPRAAF